MDITVEFNEKTLYVIRADKTGKYVFVTHDEKKQSRVFIAHIENLKLSEEDKDELLKSNLG